jgi:hypothetical protein
MPDGTQQFYRKAQFAPRQWRSLLRYDGSIISATPAQVRRYFQQMNQRLIQSEARTQAMLLQIKPERLDYALRLADLSHVKIDADGSIDTASIKSALEQMIKDIPELKATETQPAGFRVGAGDGTDAVSDDDALRRAFGLKPRN